MSKESKSPKKLKIEKFYCNTRRAVECKSELIWKIEGVADTGMYQKPAKILRSPKFGLGRETEFSVLVYLVKDPEISAGDEFIGSYISLVKGPSCCASFEFSLIDTSGKKAHEISGSSIKFGENKTWGIESFVSLKELLAQPSLICDNQVTLSCEISVWEEPETSGLCDKSLVVGSSIGKSSMPEDWKSFYEQKLNTDVVLKVGSGQFEAHKAVLMCRSPVFAAMLCHDMREKSSNEIIIEDVDSDVFEDLLKYMYVDDFTRPNVGFVVKLLIAADRFDVRSLRSRCTDYLCDHLTPEHVLEVLQLPEPCRSEELDKKCLDLVEREMLRATSAVHWLKRMADLPEILRLVKKIFVDERCPTGED